MESMRIVPRDEWHGLFGVVCTAVRGSLVEVEAASLELGDQTVVPWLPLRDIEFDSEHDRVAVMMDGVDHLILHPRSIAVLEGSGGITGVAIVTDDDVKEVLRFRMPLLLPAATS